MLRKYMIMLLVLFLAVGLLVGGCGGNEGSDQSANQQTEEQQDQAPVTEQQPVDVKIASLDVGSKWYNYAASFAELIRQELPEGSIVDVLPYSGTIGNVKLVGTGEAPVGLTMSMAGNWGYKGKVVFEQKYEDLRVLVGGFDQYYYATIVREEVPIDSLKDVKDKKVPIKIVTQPVGSLGESGSRLLLDAYGLTEDDITGAGGSITHTSTEVIASDMKDGRANVLMQATSVGHPAVTDISISTDIKFLNYEDEIIKKLEEYGFNEAILPAGSFKGQDEDVKMVGMSTILIANANLPDEVAYSITKAIIENAEQLRQNHGSMKSFDPAGSLKKTGGIPLHPGAEQYYREAGLLK